MKFKPEEAWYLSTLMPLRDYEAMVGSRRQAETELPVPELAMVSPADEHFAGATDPQVAHEPNGFTVSQNQSYDKPFETATAPLTTTTFENTSLNANGEANDAISQPSVIQGESIAENHPSQPKLIYQTESNPELEDQGLFNLVVEVGKKQKADFTLRFKGKTKPLESGNLELNLKTMDEASDLEAWIQRALYIQSLKIAEFHHISKLPIDVAHQLIRMLAIRQRHSLHTLFQAESTFNPYDLKDDLILGISLAIFKDKYNKKYRVPKQNNP